MLLSRAHRTLAALTLLLVVAGLAACSDDDPPPAAPTSSAPGSAAAAVAQVSGAIPIDLRAPSPDELAPGVELGDQLSRAFRAVAAHEETVVAVGYTAADNVVRTLFAVSDDGGRRWQEGAVDDASPGSTTSEEYPEIVTGGPDGFLAVGYDVEGRPVTWRSADGHTWARSALDPAVFRTDDAVARVTRAGGRYYLAGTSNRPFRAALGTLVLWTSDDGVTWQRRDLMRRGGLGATTGDPYVAGLVVRGREVLVAGGVTDDDDATGDARIRLWRSRDGGRRFVPDPTVGFPAVRTYLRDLVVRGGRVHLLLQAGTPGPEEVETGWNTVVVDVTGRKLQVLPGLATTDEEYPAALAPLGRGWLVGANVAAGSDVRVVTSSDGFGGQRVVRSPSLTATGEQTVSGAVGLGSRVVMVGATSRTGSLEPAVWVAARGGVERVPLPSSVGRGRPTTSVAAVVAAEGEVVVGGSVDSSPVAWVRDGASPWSVQGLAGRERSPEVYLNDLAVLPDGDVLGVGSVAADTSASTIAWRRDDQGWRKVTSGTFRHAGATGFGTMVAVGVAAGPRRVVVATVGSDANRMAQVEPLVSADAGRSWRRADGARDVGTDADDLAGRTAWAGFRAPANGSISASAVAWTGRGFLMVGSRQEPGAGSRPVAWRSRRGDVWRTPEPLPVADGVHSSSVAHLAAGSDGRVVAIGPLQPAIDDPTRDWSSWASSDGGVTWTRGEPVVGGDGYASHVEPVGDGWLALGATGPEADRDGAAWVSADGLRWTPLDLAPWGIEASGPGFQALGPAALDGETFRVVLLDVPPGGGGHRVVDVPLADVAELIRTAGAPGPG